MRLPQFVTFSCTAFGCALGFSSCHFLEKNFSLASDTIRSPQEDRVAVEESSSPGLMTTSAPGPEASAASSIPTVGSVQVQKGDTLSSIARKHGITLSALCTANALTSTSVIRPGQKLVLPAAGKKCANTINRPVTGTHSYKIKPGETLSSIAARHHTTVADILRANGMSPDQANKIQAGKVLRLPSGAH